MQWLQVSYAKAAISFKHSCRVLLLSRSCSRRGVLTCMFAALQRTW